MASPICVTGGSGFLGAWCVKKLLDKGYTVHTTTRSAGKAEYLKKLEGAAERLKIFSGCDLLTPGSFDAAISGCDAVLHTASPFYSQGGSEDNLVVPATEGTRNVLATCNKFGVTRVALTASTACVYVVYGTTEPNHVFTEEDWSPEDLLREKENWYCLSKVKAEKLAWEMSKAPECTFKLTVLNPCLILGPMVPGQPHLNTSSNSITGFMDGSKEFIPHECKSVVDVRDVADAHIAAIEKGTMWGRRVVLVAGQPHWAEVAGYVSHALPEEQRKKVPVMVSPKLGAAALGAPPPLPTLVDASPAEKLLGISYRSVYEMVTTSVTSMLENGFTSTSQYVPDK
eukprot:m.113330 g.113330  ORF g.113330 m.113330 type:complete len:342 (-) comp17076_c0_seq1:413-1438(-)